VAKTTEPRTERRNRRQRGSISAEEIVRGAFDVASGISLDRLSMPNLAEHLDVGVTSIYWYFRKKEDLLNAMTDIAVDNFQHELPALDPADWQGSLRLHFAEQRRIMREDPTLLDLLLIRTSSYSKDATRRVFEVTEELVSILMKHGFTPDNALRVYNTISVYTRGIIIHDRVLRLSNAPTLDLTRQPRMADWTTMPILASMVDRYSFSGTFDEDFEFGLDRLICGFERLLAEQDTTPTKPVPIGPTAKSGAAS
jgi:AcrR family transcriptional regulator